MLIIWSGVFERDRVDGSEIDVLGITSTSVGDAPEVSGDTLRVCLIRFVVFDAGETELFLPGVCSRVFLE